MGVGDGKGIWGWGTGEGGWEAERRNGRTWRLCRSNGDIAWPFLVTAGG